MSTHSYVIIGAGPAGLQLAYYLDRAGHDYVVLEANRVAHFFRHLPRHRRLISNNKVYTGFTDADKNLRWDWNSLLSEDLSHLFTTYTDKYFPDADVIVPYLDDYRERFSLNVQEGVRVTSIARDDEGTFRLTLHDGTEMLAERVIVATGHTVAHTPDVPGMEHCEQYEKISTDPMEYRNQRVLIVGKGNSGMETAENIFSTAASVHMLSPNPVRLAWTTHHVSDIRACYNNTLDSYQLKMQHTILDAHLEKVELMDGGKRKVTFQYTHAKDQTWELEVDRVVLACGFRFDFGIFDQSSLPTTLSYGRWPAMTSSWESTDIPGLYFVGTLMQSRDYKRSFSGFIHGFRYNIRFLSEIFAERYHGKPRQAEQIEPDADSLTRSIIDRANHASSIFQLPAFMADVYVLHDPSGKTLRHCDTTVDYALDYQPWKDRSILVSTLEYGHLPAGADPFNFPRDPLDGTTSQFIHPVLRLYVNGELAQTYHVPEDLENEWGKEMYLGPCRQAMREMLDRAAPVAAAAR